MLGGGGGAEILWARTIIFQRENLNNLIVCFTSVPCFFNTFDFYCRFVCRALSVRCI